VNITAVDEWAVWSRQTWMDGRKIEALQGYHTEEQARDAYGELTEPGGEGTAEYIEAFLFQTVQTSTLRVVIPPNPQGGAACVSGSE
jgi:hypothetical protein